MKILVISDTHGHLENARNVIKKLCDRISVVFHLGDFDRDALQLKNEFPQLKFYYVKGNNDYGSDTPSEIIAFEKGKKFLLIHGHKQRVNWNCNSIIYLAEEKCVDAAIFGHTHTPLNDIYGNIIFFNPGSISYPRNTQYPTFGIIDIDDKGIMRPVIMDYCGKDLFSFSKCSFTV